MARRAKSIARQPDSAAKPATPPGQRWWWWVLLLAAVGPVAFRQVTVSDAWWHVALGKWLVERWSLPDVTQFYFTAVDVSQVASELRWSWLGDILLYLLYAAGGAVGLQLLSVAALLVAGFFLSRLGPGRAGPWTLVLLVLVALGTYQLQMPRNSVFSLALYPVVLWLGLRKTGPPTRGEWLALGAVLALWSCLHGSCLLGWVTGALLFGGRAATAFQGGARAGWQAVGLAAAALALSLTVLLAGRTGAGSLLLAPLRHFTEPTVALPTAAPALTPGAPPASANSSPTWPQRARAWLNTSIWKPEPGVPQSNDFRSPFDFADTRPLQAAAALVLLAGARLLVLRRRVAPGLMLAWVGAVFLGLGYLRLTGYAALASAAVILAGRGGLLVASGRGQRWVPVAGWIAVGVWVAFAARTTIAGRWDRFIPEGLHVSRGGQVPAYDDALCDWVRAEFPTERTLTTIDTGSHALLRWGFAKPVFVDGFFAPHTRAVWREYEGVKKTGNLAGFQARTGVTVALLPSGAGGWVMPFFESPDWRPVAVGAGSVVFLHRSVPFGARQPRIFCSVEDLRRTSLACRVEGLRVIYNVLQSVGQTPHSLPAEAWLGANAERIEALNRYLAEAVRELETAR